MRMEKLTLNNEIVKCRAMIRKARVRVIRKKIKQIKLLKGSKNQDPKKLQKAERFLKEVMILKKIKEDDVTKFALQQNSSDKIRADNDTDRSLAILAIQKEVKETIDKIKEQVKAEALPELLRTLGTRSMLKKFKMYNKGITPQDVKARRLEKSKKVSKREETPTDRLRKDDERNESSGSDEEFQGQDERISQVTLKNQKQKSGSEFRARAPKDIPDGNQDYENSSSDDSPAEVTKIRKKNPKRMKSPSPVKEIKVDDPFFIGKKVTLPRLLLAEVEEDPTKEIKLGHEEEEERGGPWRRNNRFFNNLGPTRFDKQKERGRRPDRTERMPQREEPVAIPEKLHPSWAAKRQAQTIKPFQGKKITFDTE